MFLKHYASPAPWTSFRNQLWWTSSIVSCITEKYNGMLTFSAALDKSLAHKLAIQEVEIISCAQFVAYRHITHLLWL